MSCKAQFDVIIKTILPYSYMQLQVQRLSAFMSIKSCCNNGKISHHAFKNLQSNCKIKTLHGSKEKKRYENVDFMDDN